VALVTIFVLTFLMVLQGPKPLRSWISAVPEDRQERVRRVAADCSKAVTGYMTGNLVISVIAGTLTSIVLWTMGVPYKGVVALFVGFADLIPLVGPPCHHVSHRPAVGLTVTIAILLGVELLGFLGALAIPVAGILHVIGRDLDDGYRIKPEPTIGQEKLDRDGPVLLLGDDPLTDAGMAPRHLLGVDLQLLLGAGQGLLASLGPPVVGRVRTSRRGGCGGRDGGRALGQPEDLLGLEHNVVGGQVADGLDPECLVQSLAAPLAEPAQGLDRGVGQLVDVAVLVSPVDVLPCLGSSHGWIASW
jgi:hypothetical protein